MINKNVKEVYKIQNDIDNCPICGKMISTSIFKENLSLDRKEVELIKKNLNFIVKDSAKNAIIRMNFCQELKKNFESGDSLKT